MNRFLSMNPLERTMKNDDDRSETWKRGHAVRTEVLGEDFVKRAHEGADDFSRDLQDHVTEHAWGASWARPGLDRRTRSMLTLAMLAALNRPHEMETHLRGAIRNGVTKDEIKEVFLQAAVYCGAPAGVDGFRTARKVFEELGIRE